MLRLTGIVLLILTTLWAIVWGVNPFVIIFAIFLLVFLVMDDD